jgi:serine protease 16
MRSALLFHVLACGALPITPLTRRFFEEHHRQLRGEMSWSVPPALWFNQTLDHFDVLGGGMEWPQRFWVNATFWKGASSPVFLYIEGEGAGSAYSVVSGEHVELAATYGALLVALEHRYYGASVPVPDFSTANMRFLSSHQSIADIATFYDGFLKPHYNLTENNRVVTFGGSYPGALSAWARLRLPHIVHAAVSTSSPIQASFDDTSYNDVVANSLALPIIGGSPACTAATAAAFEAMDAAFAGAAAERHAMATKLMSCTGLDAKNDTMWAASNYGSFVQGMVQYNLETGYNVQKFCAEMTKPGRAPIDAFAAVIAATQNGQCMDNAYADYLLLLQNTTADKGANGLGLRQWTWQCCTQFSYWQDCDKGTACPLSKTFMTLDSNTQQCVDAFGPEVSRFLNTRTTRFTNAYMGGQAIASSRIIFVNGNVDPWHALSLWNSSSPVQPSVFIDGTAHCRNMCKFRSLATLRTNKRKPSPNTQPWKTPPHRPIPPH